MGKQKFSSNRRKFLKGAAVAGAASLASPMKPAVEAAYERPAGPPLQSAAAGRTAPPAGEVLTTEHCGSDFMVDVLKSLDIEYFCSNPGSSFRALHESIINYGGNQKPEF